MSLDIHVKFGDSTLNSYPTLCHGSVVLRTLRTCVQYLIIAFCSRPEPASDVISGCFVGPIASDKPAKLSGPRANHFGEIPPEAVGGSISTVF